MTRQSGHTRPAGQRGQALVILAISVVALLVMTSLVIDGGNAFAQQRITQNGVDAAAEAGAVVLAENLIAKGDGVTSLPKSDQAVLQAIQSAASNNAISTNPTAAYTDIRGDLLAGPVLVGSLGAAPRPQMPTASR